MKKALLLTIIVLMAIAAKAAPTITQQQAKAKAQAFLEQRQASGKTMRRSAAVELREAATGFSELYAFNADAGGFVIVSADGNTPKPILGYSDTGRFDVEQMPPALQRLLESYAARTDDNDDDDSNDDEPTDTPNPGYGVKTDIAPMTKTKWGQDAPYNNKTPIETVEGEKKRTVTGCVSTAMAQVLYYLRWPEGTTTEIPKYYWGDALPPVTFDYDAMQETYDAKAPAVAQDAVATLIQYCGWAIRSNYSTIATSSNTEWVVRALYRYFGYDEESISVAYRDYMEENVWFNALYNELADGRPVIMGGQGHQFVCDGYQTGDYYHINWGWNGNDDGYFLLDNNTRRKPKFAGKAPHFPEDFVMGMKKTTKAFADENARLSTSALLLTAPTTKPFTRTGDSDFPAIPVKYVLYNTWSEEDIDHFDIGFGLCQNDKLLKVLDETANVEVRNDARTQQLTASFAFGQGLADGTYKICPISREAGTNEWFMNEDLPSYHIDAVISGDKMTLSVAPANLFFVVNSLTFEGKLERGQRIKAIANVTNPNSTPFQANIVLTETNEKEFAYLCPYLAPGETKDLVFEFLADKANQYKVYLWCDRFLYGDGVNLNIVEPEVPETVRTDLKLEKTFNTESVVEYQDGVNLYGRAFNSVVSFHNPSATDAFYGNLDVYLTIRDEHDSDIEEIAKVTLKNVYVLANSTYDVKIQSNNLEFGKEYVLLASNNNGEFNDSKEIKYLCVQGITNYLSDGTIQSSAPDKEYVVPEQALCVDLGEQSVIKITPNTNPNCLYILSQNDALPQGITEKNVVRYTKDEATAEEVQLSDGYGFYSPMAFVAKKASYVRTFAASECNGYTTLMIPFTVNAITANSQPVALSVYDFVSDEPGKVYVSETKSGMPENGMPYLVKVTNQSLAGQPVTFTGQNVKFYSEYSPTSAGDYQFVCNLSAKHDDVFELFTFEAGQSGTSIPKQTDCAAFRCYFKTLGYPGRYDALTIEDTTTGIASMSDVRGMMSDVYYDLQGRCLGTQLPTQKGLYIKGNKKIMMK